VSVVVSRVLIVDGETLAEVPFLADALARLEAAVADLLDLRWPALTAAQVAAAVRTAERGSPARPGPGCAQ
jgi:hypothetical protein